MRNLVIFGFSLFIALSFGCAEGELTAENSDQNQQNSTDNGETNNTDNNDDQLPGNGNDDNDETENHCDDVSCQQGVCDPDSGDCVACLGDDDCGQEAVCDESQPECVECVEDNDCEDAVCNTSTSECVECTESDDCPDELHCDTDQHTCLGCVDDDDCAGEAKCHDVYPSCVAECCDFIQEDVFVDVPYTHDRFDIAVTAEGDPMIAFIDRDTDNIRLAERIDDNWYTQIVTSLSQTLSSNIRLELDDQANPHIVLRVSDHWTYHWRDGSVWDEQDVWDEQLGSGYTDIALDSSGHPHFVGLGGYSDAYQVYYATYSPQNGWQREGHDFDLEVNLNWTNIDMTSDDEPVVSLSAFDDENDIFVARQSDTDWETELVVEDVAAIHSMAVGPDDEVMVVYRPQEFPHDGLQLSRDGSGSWTAESINSEQEAMMAYLDIDDRNDPHVIFNLAGSGDFENHLAYTRFDGADWQTEGIGESLVERAFWQRIAVDGDYTAHIAVYDSDRDTISYVTVQ